MNRTNSINTLIIELKETFKALQNVKKSVKIEHINDNLINTSNPIISTKNDVLETSFENGADYGSLLELFYSKEFLLLSHEIENYFQLARTLENRAMTLKKTS